MTSKATILLVDDEAFNLDIMIDFLSFDNYATLKAEDGLQAIEVLKNDPVVDLIILDRMMPNMDGMELIKVLKANEKWKDIPIIMQTAAATSDQVKEGMSAGVYYYLTKPYEYESLIAVVNAALNKEAVPTTEMS